jgi:hypothetical protein
MLLTHSKRRMALAKATQTRSDAIADAETTLEKTEADAAGAAAQTWAQTENSPLGQYQATLAADAQAYADSVLPEEDGLLHAEDKALADETVSDDAADYTLASTAAGAHYTSETLQAQASDTLADGEAVAAQSRADQDTAAWQSYQDNNATSAATFTQSVDADTYNYSTAAATAWQSYQDATAGINYQNALASAWGLSYPTYQQDLAAAAKNYAVSVATAQNTRAHADLTATLKRDGDSTGFTDQYQKSYHADEAGWSAKVEGLEGAAQSSFTAAFAGEDKSDVAAAATDAEAHAGDVSAAVATVAPADAGFWKDEAGFSATENESDATAAQTMDDTEAETYLSEVQSWAAGVNTPAADEQEKFAAADVAWVTAVAAAEVTDVTATDQADETLSPFPK